MEGRERQGARVLGYVTAFNRYGPVSNIAQGTWPKRRRPWSLNLIIACHPKGVGFGRRALLLRKSISEIAVTRRKL
jgi:hypothetical protein